MIFIILFSLAHVFCAVGTGPHPTSSIYNCVGPLRATAASTASYPVNSTLVSFPCDLLRKNFSSGNLINFPRINIDTIRYPSWQQLRAYSNTITHTRHYIVYATSNSKFHQKYTRVGTLIVATIYLQLIQNRYMFRSFTVLQCSHQHCVQPVASDVEVVEYL